MAKLHNRMPVILEPADYDAWLDRASGGAELLRPCPEEWLEAVPISTRVNSPGNDDVMAKLHNRMPVILEPADYDAWLDPASGGAELLRPCPEEWLEAVPISTRVNSPGNDDETIISLQMRPLPRKER